MVNILEYSFSVWNRWGDKLFETTEPDKGWDGICNKNKGNVCQQGGYVYYVRYMNAFGERDFKTGVFVLVHKGVDF